MHRLCVETVTGKVWHSQVEEPADKDKEELLRLTGNWKVLNRLQLTTDVGEVHLNPAHVVAIWFEEVKS